MPTPTPFEVSAAIDAFLRTANLGTARAAIGSRLIESGEHIDSNDLATAGGWKWARTGVPITGSPDGTFLKPYGSLEVLIGAENFLIRFTGEHTVDLSGKSGTFYLHSAGANEDAHGIYFTGTPGGVITLICNGPRRMYVAGDLLDCPSPITIENASVPYFQITCSEADPLENGGAISETGNAGKDGVMLIIRSAITGNILSASGQGGQGGPSGDQGGFPSGNGGLGGNGNGITLEDCTEAAAGSHSCPAALGGAAGVDIGDGVGAPGALGTPGATSYAFNCNLLSFSTEGHSGPGGTGFIRYQSCRVNGNFVADTNYYTGFGAVESRHGAAIALD